MSQNEVGSSPKCDRRYYSKEEKIKAVELTEKIGTIAASKELGVADGNLSRWRSQFKKSGVDGLINKSSRPHHQPKKTSQ